MAGSARERWRGVIESQAESGLSVAEFCRRHDVSPASFYAWRKRLREENAASRHGKSTGAFTALRVVDDAAVSDDAGGGASIEFPGGAVLRLPATGAAMRQAILALMEAGGER